MLRSEFSSRLAGLGIEPGIFRFFVYSLLQKLGLWYVILAGPCRDLKLGHGLLVHKKPYAASKPVRLPYFQYRLFNLYNSVFLWNFGEILPVRNAQKIKCSRMRLTALCLWFADFTKKQLPFMASFANLYWRNVSLQRKRFCRSLVAHFYCLHVLIFRVYVVRVQQLVEIFGSILSQFVNWWML